MFYNKYNGKGLALSIGHKLINSYQKTGAESSLRNTVSSKKQDDG